MMRRLSEGNLSLSKAFYSHTKILVMALNGPAVGLSAALLGVSSPRSITANVPVGRCRPSRRGTYFEVESSSGSSLTTSTERVDHDSLLDHLARR